MSNSASMAKEFKLPLIPGTSCGEEMLRRNYRKTQIFGGNADRVTKTPGVLLDKTAANDALLSTYGADVTSGTEGGSPSKSSALLGGKVLRFFGYTLETVQESAQEKQRVRKVVLCYFLEDGTISISEPRLDNSGFAFAGTLIKRHVIPTPDNSQVTFDALAVGGRDEFGEAADQHGDRLRRAGPPGFARRAR